ncbi:septum formation inhibitor Maf, partial [Xanthomonas hyacinthi DSM 19077]
LRGERALQLCDLTEVRFRVLQAEEIARYVAAEQPLDCAGSFKCEGLGISLFSAIHSQDPTALVGLPLIGLAGLLREAGYVLP